MALGLDGSFGSSQSLGSDPALDPTRGHLMSLDSSNSLVTLIPPKKRKKEGIRAGGREGGRKKGEKQERRKGFR